MTCPVFRKASSWLPALTGTMVSQSPAKHSKVRGASPNALVMAPTLVGDFSVKVVPAAASRSMESDSSMPISFSMPLWRAWQVWQLWPASFMREQKLVRA